jgi:hypothetical protein
MDAEKAEECPTSGDAPRGERGGRFSDSSEPRPSSVSAPWRTIKAEILLAGLSSLVSGFVTFVTLRLWSAHLNVPLSTGMDVPLNMMLIRNMQSTGSANTTPLLGAPFGQDLAPWPASAGDSWHMLALKFFSLFLSPAASMNIFYLLTFPMVAAFAYLGFRGLGLSRTFGVPLAVAYSLLPYHFLRGESHFFLGSYFMVPLASLVAYWVYTGDVNLARRPRAFSWREWCTIAVAAVLLGTGLYYAIFGIILISAASVLRTITDRSARPLASAAVVSVIVGTGLFVSNLPTLLFRGVPGAEDAVAGRTYAATEYFGMKIVNLLLPPSYHRIPALAGLHSRTSDSLIPGEGTESLGMLGVAGLVIITVALLVLRSEDRAGVGRRLRAFGVFAIISVLCATVGGLNGVLAIFGLAQLRGWNRMSVYVAFFALAGLGIALGRVAGAVRARSRWAGVPVAAVTASLLVLAIAVFDQTSSSLAPDYDSIATAWDSDHAYFQRAEQEFGAGTAIFQLPLVSFPEGGTVGSMPYNDHLFGYVHSDLAWSFGGVKGQDNGWQEIALRDGVAAAIPKLVAAGFEGIDVSRLAYADRGAGVEAEIISVLGPQVPLVSADNLRAVYDLRPYASALREKGAILPTPDAVLRPVQVRFGAGFYDPESVAGVTWRWAQRTADASLINPTNHDARVEIRGRVIVRGADAETTVTIGGNISRLTVINGTAEIDLTVTIPSGTTPLTLWTDGQQTTQYAESRTLYQQVIGPTVTTVG